MTISSAAAAAAATREAARRAAAKKAAEAAAKKAAEAAAKKVATNAQKTAANAAVKKAAKSIADKSAQEISQRAGQRPAASAVRQAFGKDELSRGMGTALRARAGHALGSPAPSAPTPAGRTVSSREMQAIQARGGSISAFRSPDSIDRAAQAKAAEVTGPPAPVTPETRAAQGARDVEKAFTDAQTSGKTDAEAANAASQKLRELTSGDDVAYNNALIRSAQPTLDKVTTVIATNAADDGFTGETDQQAVKDSIRALSDVATASGEIGSFMIADQLAQKIPDESELMHVDDAFYEHSDAGGENHLMAALSARLQAHGKDEANDELVDRHEGSLLGDVWGATGGKLINAAVDVVGAVGDGLGAVTGFVGDAAEGVLNVVGAAGEMAVDVAKGTVELAGDAADWTTETVTAAAEYAAKNGLKLAGEALNWVGDHARDMAAELLDIDGQLAQLNSPGDSMTMSVGGSIGATVLQGGAEVEMQVTRLEDGGYEMTLTGQLSGGVFGGLSLPGFPSAEGEANATGIATATMKFDDLDGVTQAAETVGGIGIAAAVGGPAGALLTGATASSEIRDITDHFESGSVGIELSAEAKASLGETAGLGAGGEISGTVTTGARLEITKGQPPALVLEQSIEAEGSLALGLPVDIPALGGKLNGGSIDGSASVSAETRIPLSAGMNLADVVSDPVGAIKDVGQSVIDNSTTKLSIDIDVSAGVATEGLPIDFGSNGGLEISLSGEAKTKDLVGALAKALSGDLSGALTLLGTKTDLQVDVNSYTESNLVDIDENISVPGFTIGVKAQDTVRDETDVWSFEGTPAELAAQNFNLFKSLDLNVS